LVGGGVGIEGIFGWVDELDGVLELWEFVSMRCMWRGNAGCEMVLMRIWGVLDLPQVFNAVSMIEDRK
jgi:hypothetical protein